MNKSHNQQKDNAAQEDHEDEYVSKTQRKQEADALKKLGLDLVNLPASQLTSLPIDEELLEAIAIAGRINRKKDGFRRQVQLIGKLLRSRDAEAIQLALDKLAAPHLVETQKFHKLERMRDQILVSGDKAIQTLVETHPSLDRQKLRQFYRQAVKQKELEKPPIAARQLFQYLKTTMHE